MKLHLLAACALQLVIFCGASAAAAQSSACATAAHHQFDFWLGSWKVADGSGKFQGTNTVTREYDGCVIQEHWTGAGGSRGSSFNTYIPSSKQWQQTWVDNSGLTLHLVGGRDGNTMVLAGDRVDRAGKTVTDRISWTPLADGRVRQHWQQRSGTGPWHDVFDGYYSHQ